MPPRTPSGSRPGFRSSAVLAAIFLLCLVPELVLSGADLGLWGSPGWRSAAIGYGAFWSGLLHNWRPLYPGQAAAMFLTYAFLHGGALHFAVNMVTLASLGPPCLARTGPVRFLAIYLAATVGGALAFALIGSDEAPMVGASGALFGLAGALLAWEFRLRRAYRAPLWPVLRAILLLVALNVLFWWAMHGLLAWQTHLGAFLAGGAAALLLSRRP